MVAYPTVDRAALRVLAEDDAARQAITLMVDSTEQLDFIDATLGSAHPRIRVCLEFDASWRPIPGVHIGARRSPVFTPRQAVKLATAIERRRGFRLVGVMGYEGQIAGVPDGDPGVAGAAVRWMQRRSAAELARRRAAVVAAVRTVAELEFVNGGGTGSLESTRTDSSVTEVAAGSGLLAPALFSRYQRFQPRPAALFALPVVRKPARRTATLAAGGYVASGQAGQSRLPSPTCRMDCDCPPWKEPEKSKPRSSGAQPADCGWVTACGSGTPRPVSSPNTSRTITSCWATESCAQFPPIAARGVSSAEPSCAPVGEPDGPHRSPPRGSTASFSPRTCPPGSP